VIPEPCRLSRALSQRRKELRIDLNTWQKEWIRGFGVVDRAYVHDIRLAHILRMDGLPKTFPDGRPLPKASQGHLPSKKRTEAKGRRRRPI
jgi:hypothetical protein